LALFRYEAESLFDSGTIPVPDPKAVLQTFPSISQLDESAFDPQPSTLQDVFILFSRYRSPLLSFSDYMYMAGHPIRELHESDNIFEDIALFMKTD